MYVSLFPIKSPSSGPEAEPVLMLLNSCTDKSFPTRQDAEDFVAGKNPATASDKPEKFYAVAVGNEPGIYGDWETAQLAIKGVKGPKYKKFDTRAEAVEFIYQFGNETAQATVADEAPAAKKSKKTGAATGDEDEELEVEEDGDAEVEGVLHICTDGSSLSNGKVGAVAGVGVYFGPDDPRNVSERLEGEPQTNQRAELTAILRALQKVPVSQDVRIVTDSKYSISCVMEWYVNWEIRGWKTTDGSEVKNKDLIAAIRKKIKQREKAKTRTLFKWVKGHAKDLGNIAADELAVRGAKLK
ncbi:ribonuclease H-like domain-containing protein [Pseudomassariella vexata]|uniref:Ribonuclease H n=1 Tax=Pseudomassariella vexata TaxID=1141098 RepID=A0A1Y2DXT0_9PEZI|nr:ribonuclease H-like domain-containing protein [Pseudomassariella vexata]ORY64110.1 ribonuclease H-like domain-containing protein [Pseudomassariella vexata]